MQKTIKKLSLVLLVLLTAFPFGQEVFADVPARPGFEEGLIQTQEPAQNPVRVSGAPALAQIPVVVVRTAAGCGVLAKPGSRNLAQDPDLVDFNQPAGCFSLSLGRVARIGSLEVRPLAARPLKVVLLAAAEQEFLSEQDNNPDWSKISSMMSASVSGGGERKAVLEFRGSSLPEARTITYSRLSLAFLGIWRC